MTLGRSSWTISSLKKQFLKKIIVRFINQEPVQKVEQITGKGINWDVDNGRPHELGCWKMAANKQITIPVY